MAEACTLQAERPIEVSFRIADPLNIGEVVSLKEFCGIHLWCHVNENNRGSACLNVSPLHCGVPDCFLAKGAAKMPQENGQGRRFLRKLPQRTTVV
jgi:hypothetical protein